MKKHIFNIASFMMLLTLGGGLSSCSDSYLEDVNTDDSKAETIDPNAQLTTTLLQTYGDFSLMDTLPQLHHRLHAVLCRRMERFQLCRSGLSERLGDGLSVEPLLSDKHKEPCRCHPSHWRYAEHQCRAAHPPCLHDGRTL